MTHVPLFQWQRAAYSVVVENETVIADGPRPPCANRWERVVCGIHWICFWDDWSGCRVTVQVAHCVDVDVAHLGCRVSAECEQAALCVQDLVNDGQNPRSRLFHPSDTQDVGSPRRAKRNARGDRHGVADIGNLFAFCNTNGRDHHVTESMKVFRLDSMNPPGQN